MVAATALAPAAQAGWLHAQPAVARIASAPRLVLETGSSLEAEFEALKAAAAPAKRRKRDVVTRKATAAVRGVRAVFTLPRELTKAVKEVVDDSCDLENPEVCTEQLGERPPRRVPPVAIRSARPGARSPRLPTALRRRMFPRPPSSLFRTSNGPRRPGRRSPAIVMRKPRPLGAFV